jgi:hypothetical protein
LVANSVRAEDVSYIESKHLLRILGEINDIEVIWLRFYQRPFMSGDLDFRSKHAAVLEPVSATMSSTDPERQRKTLQQSYKEHLVRLGLLRERFKIDSRTEMPELDQGGRPKHHGFEITALGRLLLNHIGLSE